MKNFIVKLLSFFIFNKSKRGEFRKKYIVVKPSKNTVKSKFYGKIYLPQYSNIKIEYGMPEIYNKDGKKMEMFFLRDAICAHRPYRHFSKYFMWDRYNVDLKTHFYGHKSILETIGNPDRKYAFFEESESIIPQEYRVFEDYKGIEKDFDAVFTYSEKLLNTLDNAKIFPFTAIIWYSNEIFNGQKDTVVLNDKCFELKDKNVSMMCSNKIFTEMHKIRHQIAEKAIKNDVKIYGKFNGGEYLKFKSDSLEKYRYQIVVENDVQAYYFTEKIMDCFASQTIPIYLGATKIDEFFNTEGIIQISKDDDIEKVLKQCTEAEYERRLPAIIDNYNRSLKYLNLDDMLYEKYFMNET